MLHHIGLNQTASAAVIRECYPAHLIDAGILAGAAKTVAYCAEAGILSDPDSAAKFAGAGLI
jgi:hypothetical protein